MGAAFTPGPWEFQRHIPDSQWFGNIIGYYAPRADGMRMSRTITCQLKNAPTEENEANAHLIAAAPELYEALTGMIGRYAKFGPFDEICAASEQSHETNDALAALAKARGEQ